MNSMKKRLVSGLVLSAMAMSLTVGASAAEIPATRSTDDRTFAFKVTSSYQYTSSEKKEDKTAIYVYYDTGDYSAIRVTAYGKMSKDGSKVNYTELSDRSTVSYVYVPINQKTSVHNGIYEGGKSYAQLGIRAKSSSSDYVAGVWSPDSTRYYTSATNTL